MFLIHVFLYAGVYCIKNLFKKNDVKDDFEATGMLGINWQKSFFFYFCWCVSDFNGDLAMVNHNISETWSHDGLSYTWN